MTDDGVKDEFYQLTPITVRIAGVALEELSCVERCCGTGNDIGLGHSQISYAPVRTSRYPQGAGKDKHPCTTPLPDSVLVVKARTYQSRTDPSLEYEVAGSFVYTFVGDWSKRQQGHR